MAEFSEVPLSIKSPGEQFGPIRQRIDAIGSTIEARLAVWGLSSRKRQQLLAAAIAGPGLFLGACAVEGGGTGTAFAASESTPTAAATATPEATPTPKTIIVRSDSKDSASTVKIVSTAVVTSETPVSTIPSPTETPTATQSQSEIATTTATVEPSTPSSPETPQQEKETPLFDVGGYTEKDKDRPGYEYLKFFLPEHTLSGKNPLIKPGEDVSILLDLENGAQLKDFRFNIGTLFGVEDLSFAANLDAPTGVWKGSEHEALIIERLAKEGIRVPDDILDSIRIDYGTLPDGKFRVKMGIENQSYEYQTPSGTRLINPFQAFAHGGKLLVVGRNQSTEYIKGTDFIIGNGQGEIVGTDPEIVFSEGKIIRVQSPESMSETPVAIQTARAAEGTALVSSVTPEALAEKPSGVEVPENMPLVTFKNIEPGIAIRTNPDGTFSLEKTPYDTIITITIPETMMDADGTNDLSIDLRPFLGSTVHPMPDYLHAADMAIAVPKIESEFAALKQDINPQFVIDHIPTMPGDALEQVRKSVADRAVHGGFDAAFPSYIQTLKNAGLTNVAEATDLLRTQTEQRFAKEAPYTLLSLGSQIAVPADAPSDVRSDITHIQQEISGLMKDIGAIATEQGIDAATGALQQRIKQPTEAMINGINSKYGAYGVHISTQAVLAEIDTKYADLILKSIPDLTQDVVPTAPSTSQIQVKDGYLHYDGLSTVISFAVDEPDTVQPGEYIDTIIMGDINGAPIELHTRRKKLK